MYIWRWEDGVFLGGIVAAAAATTVGKRVSIVRVIKVNLSFEKLKIFQMVQNFNNIQSVSYIFIVWKKKLKKVKRGCYRNEKTKNNKKILSDIDFRRTSTTLPFKNLTLRTISSKKSPQMAPNPLTGGLVYGSVTKISF